MCKTLHEKLIKRNKQKNTTINRHLIFFLILCDLHLRWKNRPGVVRRTKSTIVLYYYLNKYLIPFRDPFTSLNNPKNAAVLVRAI